MNITLIGIAVTAAIWMGSKPEGYLVRTGPAPLRFQSPAKGPEFTVELPPLAMTDPEPPAPAENLKPQPATNEVVTVEPPPPAPAPAPTPIAAEPAFTPQMLVPFFSRGATNHELNVILPLQFTPAAPNIPPPPSKATYTTK